MDFNDYLKELSKSNPLLSGFIRGLSGAAQQQQGQQAQQQPHDRNVYDGEWRRVDKPNDSKALPPPKD